MDITSCGINSVYHHIHIWLFPNRLPETALLWWAKGSALRQSSTSMEPQFLTEGQFRNTFWAPPKFTLRTRVSYAAITQDNPRYWQPAVFSGKISPTNPAVQVAQNLAYPSSDAYLVMENSPGLSQGQPLQTQTWRSWSHGTSSLLWGIICWWPQEGKREHWSLGELLTKSWIWEILGKYGHCEIQFPLCNVRQGNSHSPYPRKVSSLLTQLPEKFYHKTEAQIFFPL